METSKSRSDSGVAAGPLRGLLVVDLTTVVMGPYASQALAEYGAEVIKVEAPGGDSTRHIGPGREPGMAALYLGTNRNKRSVLLDLKSAQGQDDLLAIVAGADVFMHNMRPEKLEALGLGPEVLRAANPRLVFAALTGFGREGPYSGQPAYDDVIQGLSGLAPMMEMQSGTPRYLPTTVADKVGSLVAVGAIMAALVQRQHTGAGATVEVPMFESVVSFGLVEHSQGDLFEPPLAPPGYRRALMPSRRPYATRDGTSASCPTATRTGRRCWRNSATTRRGWTNASRPWHCARCTSKRCTSGWVTTCASGPRRNGCSRCGAWTFRRRA